MSAPVERTVGRVSNSTRSGPTTATQSATTVSARTFPTSSHPPSCVTAAIPPIHHRNPSTVVTPGRAAIAVQELGGTSARWQHRSAVTVTPRDVAVTRLGSLTSSNAGGRTQGAPAVHGERSVPGSRVRRRRRCRLASERRCGLWDIEALER